jgi:hypothetical protein
MSAAKTEYWRRRREWLAAHPDKTVEDFYKESRRILMFDTSAHDRLVKIGESAYPAYASIRSQFFFCLAGSAYEEMVSIPNAAERLAQLHGCRRLTEGRWWDCLNPPADVIQTLTAAHASDPAKFEWLKVDVRSGGLAHEIRTGELTADDALAVLQKTEQYEAQAGYKDLWQRVRANLEPALKEKKLARPKTFEEAFRNYGTSLIPGLAKGLYDAGLRAAGEQRGASLKPDTAPSIVQHFIDTCPPFRGMLYGVMMSWYNGSLKHARGQSFAAGRNDLLMAVYLPLCDVFVTRDRDQQKCLSELARFIGVRTDVQYLDDFLIEL